MSNAKTMTALPKVPRQPPSYTVIARLKDLPRGRSTAAVGAKTFLADLVADGRAEAVFTQDRAPASVRAEFTRASQGLPRIFAIGVNNEKEVQSTLDHLSEDRSVSDAYLAPPRILCSQRSNPARAAQSIGPGHWWIDEIRLLEARNLSNFKDSGNVTIAVIDSGVDRDHPDLTGAVDLVNFGMGDDHDETGHGTHVCGIIAGRNTSGKGVDGVCRAPIVVYKALDPYHPAGYYRALTMATARAQLLNLSLSGPEDPTETLLLQRAIARGVLVVAAMGNEQELGNPVLYPAAVPGVIAVGAVDSKRKLARFSNTGPHIALVAPGVGIRSSVPTYPALLAKHVDYDSFDGTSMAVPFVSGTLALVMLRRPDLSPSDLLEVIQTTLCDGQAGRDDDFGKGLLNVADTLRHVDSI